MIDDTIASMMTAEEYLAKMNDPLWYGEQDENGVDLSLIRSNLEKTPTERLRKGDQATWAFYGLGLMSDELSKARLERVAELLQRHQVQFIVIGGQAEYIFGSPRVTYDIDLCYRRTPENLQRLAAALKELKVSLRGVPKDLSFPLDARALALGSNYTFETPNDGDLDLLGHVEPLGDYERLDRSASNYQVGDLELRVIDLDDLIAIKRHINRPKDQGSLFQLLAIKRLREETGLK